MTLVSLTAYAEMHGVKKQSASDWKVRGYIVCDGAMVDVEASDRKMEEFGKGRYRVKAHGGRREAGVRGVPDRPGLTPSPPPPGPWLTWHPPGSPNTLQGALREAIEQNDTEQLDDLLETFAFSEWNDERIRLGWHQWPKIAAPRLAAAIGLPKDKILALQEALSAEVDQRLRALSIRPEELDHSLEPL